MSARQRFGLQYVSNAFDIVQHQHRQWRLWQRRIGGDRHNAIVVGIDERFADGGPIDFELGMGVALEAFNDHQIDRAQLRQNVG